MNNFLSNIIDKNLYKKDQSIKTILYEFIETIIISSSKITKYKNYNYFIQRINDIRKFNLDEESLFIEFKSKILKNKLSEVNIDYHETDEQIEMTIKYSNNEVIWLTSYHKEDNDHIACKFTDSISICRKRKNKTEPFTFEFQST